MNYTQLKYNIPHKRMCINEGIMIISDTTFKITNSSNSSSYAINITLIIKM